MRTFSGYFFPTRLANSNQNSRVIVITSISGFRTRFISDTAARYWADSLADSGPWRVDHLNTDAEGFVKHDVFDVRHMVRELVSHAPK